MKSKSIPLLKGNLAKREGVLNLFIIGPSGCGKSTQAKLIAEKYGITHISMGQLLRGEIARGSSVGLDAKNYVENGKPVPDDITLPILVEKLNQINNTNFILDGFPRVVTQGEFIDRYLANKGHQTGLVIHLWVDFAEVIRRRQKMGENFQDKDRGDNTPEAIANRQKVIYESNIKAILDYYRRQNKLFEIDGNRPIQPIFTDVCRAIDKLS